MSCIRSDTSYDMIWYIMNIMWHNIWCVISCHFFSHIMSHIISYHIVFTHIHHESWYITYLYRIHVMFSFLLSYHISCHIVFTHISCDIAHRITHIYYVTWYITYRIHIIFFPYTWYHITYHITYHIMSFSNVIPTSTAHQQEKPTGTSTVVWASHSRRGRTRTIDNRSVVRTGSNPWTTLSKQDGLPYKHKV